MGWLHFCWRTKQEDEDQTLPRTLSDTHDQDLNGTFKLLYVIRTVQNSWSFTSNVFGSTSNSIVYNYHCYHNIL